MDHKQLLRSFTYKSGSILTCRNLRTGKQEVKVFLPDGEVKRVTSVRAAKTAISKRAA